MSTPPLALLESRAVRFAPSNTASAISPEPIVTVAAPRKYARTSRRGSGAVMNSTSTIKAGGYTAAASASGKASGSALTDEPTADAKTRRSLKKAVISLKPIDR